MNQYLAKSNGETIVQHTQNLLHNLEKLQKLYPNIQTNWQLLELACLYHDLGKMNVKFQEKLDKGVPRVTGELPHGLLSTAFLSIKNLKQKYKDDEIQALAYAIAYHHERNFSEIEEDEYSFEVKLLANEAALFPKELLQIEELSVKKISPKYYKLGAQLYSEDTSYPIYVMLKGLLNRIDHAASGYISVEYKNDFLESSMKKLGYTWNPLQQYMLEHQKENVVVIAQTGMGKTEAGLLWLGNNKGFFTLPLRTAINSIYKRIQEDIVKNNLDERVGLLHSETFSQYLENYSDEEADEVREYETRTTQWTLPLTICTLDQVFDFVYLYGGYEAKLATLSYSKLIIDEIQMYSAELLAYLIKGLDYIVKAGGSFAILTATLPPFILDLLEIKGITFSQPEKPFIDENLPLRHSVEVIHEEISVKTILTHYVEKKILVICNTVKRAKAICEELQKELGEKNVHLFHSQFTKEDRRKKETSIFEFGQKNSIHKSGIWVTTQVVEASLDIDFDILFTELTDLNGLFQRMGRCYRKRSWEKEIGTNIYVFDGGEKRCSGVGFVVDQELYHLSKEVLKKISGPLDEQSKMNLIQETYTTEKVKNTNYYGLVNKSLEYLDLIITGEKSKKEVKRIFRNINNVSVIPLPVYEKNRVTIDGLVAKVQQKNEKGYTEKERKDLKYEKRIARTKLNNFKVDLPAYTVNRSEFSTPLELNKYEEIQVLNCAYTEEIGVTLLDKEKEECFF